MKHWIISFLALALLTFSSCSSTKIVSESPDKVTLTPKYERKLSNINIPLVFPVKQLEELANRQLGIVLYKDDNPDDDHVAITVSRTGPVVINAENDQLTYTVPIHVYVLGKYELDVCSVCPKIGKSQSTQFDIKVKCQTKLGITENWQITSKTNSDFEWSKKPYIELGIIQIPISKIVEPILTKQIDQVALMLDKEIQQKVEVKSKVQKAWIDLQQPIQLDKEHDAWLSITPQEIRTSTLHCKNDEISLKVGIRSYVESFTGGKPVTVINNNLPPLKIDDKLPDNFSIVLSGDIPYNFASEFIKDQFVGKFYEFENGKYHINVKEAELFGSPDKLTIRLAIDGKAGKGLFSKSINGNIFLQGTPYYDAASTSIKVKDFDFHFKTRDVLLKSASWLTRIGFKQTLQDKLSIPVKEQLEQARKMVQEGLNKNGRINNSILLKGTINSLNPEGIYLSPTSIKAVVTGVGNVSVLIDKL